MLTFEKASNSPVTNNFEINKIQDLFKFSEAGNWNAILVEVKKNPDIINATLKEGPDAGKTVLWNAAFQFVEGTEPSKQKQAESFLSKIFAFKEGNYHKFPHININAAPSQGPHRGKSIFWLLVYDMVLKHDNGEDYDSDIIGDCIRSPLSNVNAAPKEGPFKDVTAFCLLTFSFETYIYFNLYSHIISDSPPPPFKNKTLCNVIYALVWRITDYERVKLEDSDEENEKEEEIFNYKQNQKNCYDSVFKIIEDNPKCNVNFLVENISDFLGFKEEVEEASSSEEEDPRAKIHKNALEMVLSMPSFPNRNKLLVYLIFAGAEMTDTAKPEWKTEYAEILQRLKTVFQKALIVCHYNLSEGHKLNLITDLRPRIAIDMIKNEFPELKGFPGDKLVHGLNLIGNLKPIEQ